MRDRRVIRVAAGAIGAGSVGVGAFQYAVPDRAARRFGIPPGGDPASMIMMRGTGARDCFVGSALLCAAARGGDCRPWLAMRAAADAADGIAGLLALRAGTKCAGQASTTRSALVLSGVGTLLWCLSGRARRKPGGAVT